MSSPIFEDQAERVRQDILARYDQLDPVPRTIVDFLAVSASGASPALLAQVLNGCGLRDASGKVFKGPQLQPLLADLIRKLLVETTPLCRCHPLLLEAVARRLVREKRFDAFVKIVRQHLPFALDWQKKPVLRNSEELFREARIAFYRNDLPALQTVVATFNARAGWYEAKASPAEILHRILDNPFDADYLQTLPPPLLITFLWSKLEYPFLPPAQAAACLGLLTRMTGAPPPQDEAGWTPRILMILLRCEQLVLRGEWPEVAEQLTVWEQEDPQAADHEIFRAWLAFLKGDNATALALFQDALKRLRRMLGKKKIWFTRPAGLFYILALIKADDEASRRQAEEFTALAIGKDCFREVCVALNALFPVLKGQKAGIAFSPPPAAVFVRNPLLAFFQALVQYWIDPAAAARFRPGLVSLFRSLDAAGYAWFAAEAAELLHRLGEPGPYREAAASFRAKTGVRSVLDVVARQEPWVRSLAALAALGQDRPAAAGKDDRQQQSRIAWMLSITKNNTRLQPREQRRGKTGRWGQGKNVALRRLHEGQVEGLTEQDRRVCAHLKPQRYYYGTDYVFAPQAFLELAGHPHVYLAEAPSTRVEVERAAPELLIERDKKGRMLKMRLSPPPVEGHPIVFAQETPGRLRVIQFTDQHRRMAELLGNAGLSVPAEAADQVMEVAGGLAGLITVHSDVEAGGAGAREIAADPRPTLFLRPQGSGLRAHLCVRPLGPEGPLYPPGHGKATVIAVVAGEPLLAHRDLPEEARRAEQLVASCPVLAEGAESVAEREWVLPHPEECLELLLDLEARPDGVVVAWPEGRTLKVSAQKGPEAFQLRVRAQKDWFGIEGGLAVDGDRVLDLKELLALLGDAPGRFLPLGKGEFLALTEELRKRLDEMQAFTQVHGKGVRFRPLAASALSGLFAGAGKVDADKAWQAWKKRVEEARTFVPEVPSTLQAELRDYQAEGFSWLARLARLGAGACLADDMGLGKTLQALALLLTRASEGPALVVAPTSVCANWFDEARRFAPTLNCLALSAGNRREQVAALRPQDLLVVSYGLLQTEETAEILAGVEWSTVVLDEAQAIKNFQTRRSQAAMKLPAGFRLITTGTPIENHLGELWNLFRFLNPGLLGSLEEFNDRFANPIEQRSDADARRRLRKLLQPFILRRTKSQVLEELPPRTDIVLHVDLSPEEAAFYEALRQKAVETVADASGPPGARHLKILAEIMKLRRACCHPSLVMPAANIEGSKLQVLGEVVGELLASRHKALVFSQFVDHLALVRAFLAAKGIRHQYLDGSTPARDRKKAVDAFQAGEGDIFLISLKAGGTGLNLTAADYVIHLDPWWNPAVEDQASDRAHRIGQERPVTVYRLVARGTIEEKIVSLHGKKRDLAEGLLSGSDMTGKISTDELIRLIRGE